jgi:SNF2 family DNA or RNA helicase
MKNNIIFYRKGFVELIFPYNTEIATFIKQNFIFPKYQEVSKSWYIPIFLEKERKALEELKERFSFRDWYDANPEESSAWSLDKDKADLVIKYIPPKYGQVFDRIIFPHENPKLFKELKEEGMRIKRIAYWRSNKRETVISLTPSTYEYFLKRGIDNLFVEKKLKPFVENLELKLALGNLAEPLKEIKGFDYLYPFQKAGLQVLYYRLKRFKGQILADEMGLGKTIQAGALIKAMKAYPTLVVTPSSLKYSFADKLENIVKIRNIKVLQGKKTYAIPQGDVIVINYDILQEWKDRLKSVNFKLIIGDEVHYLKNLKAKRTKAFKDISKGIPYKLLMTGTPFQNSPEELWSLLDITGLSKFVAENKKEFDERFVYYQERYLASRGITIKIPVGVKDGDGLKTKLFATSLVRRTKKQVLKDLPKKIVSKELVDITNREKYDDYIRNKFNTEFLLKYAEEKGLAIPERLWDSDREEQFSWIIQNRPSIFMELHGELYKMLGEGKIKAVSEFVKDYFENNPDGKLIVFAYHKAVQEKLFKELKDFNPLWLKGEMSSKEKAEIEKIFNETDINKVLVISLMAGKEGLTLTRADTAVFTELWFNPQDLAQAEDRIHRIGQEKTANIYYFVAKDTIDEDIYRTVKQRDYSFKQVFEQTFRKRKTRSI